MGMAHVDRHVLGGNCDPGELSGRDRVNEAVCPEKGNSVRLNGVDLDKRLDILCR